MQAVSCPTIHLCVAVDASGKALYTTRPTGRTGSWSQPVGIDGGVALTGISCPTTRLCVAVDANGNVLTSTRPTHGAWSRAARIDSSTSLDGGYAGLNGISCPTTTLCVAVDGAAQGHVVATSQPLGGGRTWHMSKLGAPLTSVSCPSNGLCVIGGTKHYFSTSPNGGRSAWHATGGPLGGGLISAIDCPAISLCVGVGYGNISPGLAVSATNPRGRASGWLTSSVQEMPPVANTELLDAVGCAGNTLCVALDTADNAFISRQPAQGVWGARHAIRRNSASLQSAVSCTKAFCVVVDSSGVATTGIVHG